MTLNVLDISAHQEGISESVIAQSEEILIVKATEGVGWVSSDMERQISIARSQGKLVGLYHFAHYGDSDEQADYFIQQTAKHWGKGYAIPILDLEDSDFSPSMSTQYEFARDWLARVKSMTGAMPWVYTQANRANRFPTYLHGYPLWVAWYAQDVPQYNWETVDYSYVQRDLINWTGPVVGWQFTQYLYLNGYGANLDGNKLFADRAELEGYASGKAATEVGSTDAPVVKMPVSVNMIYPVDPSVYPPTQGFYESSTNMNAGVGHGAVDYPTPIGASVRAVADGTVVFADWSSKLPYPTDEDRFYIGDGSIYGVLNAGIWVLIDHGDFYSEYAHLNSTSLNPGDTVRMGDEIGKSGSTGYVYGAHLHFSTLAKEVDFGNGFFGRTDPEQLMIARNGYTRKTATVIDDLDSLEGIMALYSSKEEFEAALRKNVAQPILDELTPGKAGVKNAGAVFARLYNIEQILNTFTGLFLPGKEKVRSEGDIRRLFRKIAKEK